MLYWLHELFEINLLVYITVRATIAFFIAFGVTLLLMPRFIRWAKRKKTTQPILVQAPDGHKQKKNTPTMGGVVFVSSALLATFLTANLTNGFVLLGVAVLLLFMGIGYLDDSRKIHSRKNDGGLSSRGKLTLQFLSAGLVSCCLFLLPEMLNDLYVPFFKTPLFDMGLFAIFFWSLVMVASSNAVNLTDGLDGLATVPSIFSFLTLALLMYLTGHAILSQSLLMPKIIGVGEVVVLASAMIGGLIGFLWYNANPAEVFMGDSGSLSIGGLIGYMAVLAKSEILLLAIGFIFVVETLSVILQVASFKWRKQRIFLMAPLHHHFEMKQWAENKIIVRFWLVALIANLFALITIKIR